MKRDKELIRLLLAQLRDGEKPKSLSEYSEEQQGFHAALLVEEGFVRGQAVKGKHGEYIGAAMLNLTSLGYDLLEELENSQQDDKSLEQTMGLEIFVSHSAEDKDVAEALVDLLQVSLRLRAEEILCTSVDGFRLPVGADADEQLKRETVASRAFIGLITPKSIQSAYVLFELGARWGTKRTISPVFAKGADANFLKGPLRGINALDARIPAQVHQLIHDLGKQLGRPLEPAATYEKYLTRFVEAASSVAKADSDELEKSLRNLILPVPKVIRDDVMKAVMQKHLLYYYHFVRMSGLSETRVKYYLGELEKAGLIQAQVDKHGGTGYELTHQGRQYIVAENLDSLQDAAPAAALAPQPKPFVDWATADDSVIRAEIWRIVNESGANVFKNSGGPNMLRLWVVQGTLKPGVREQIQPIVETARFDFELNEVHRSEIYKR